MEKTIMPTSSYTLTISKGNGPGDVIKLDYYHVRIAAHVLRAINHKLRQQIIKLLEEHKRMTVTEIYVKLRLEQSVASQHLSILRRNHIVKYERDGKFIFYSLDTDALETIARVVDELYALKPEK
ncbi:ArsR/SmtB family transcription factor [Thermoflavifilum aggregans]|nr:metalloregulator ArsR/SmtB family transcription factor [Thermoflavifilum aggregans]